jgi:hypothetical protein
LAEQSDSNEDSLFGSGGANQDLQKTYVDFLDGVSLLQRTELAATICEEEKICLFLNLYHCMLLHGFLVVGVPNTHFKWTYFFNSCAYAAFGDVFTLAELQQHIVLHSVPASTPTVASSEKDRYEFSLRTRDPRLLWALNSGLVASQPHVIPIYESVSLNEQLDNMVSISLTGQITVSDPGDELSPVSLSAAAHIVTPTVTVPRICKLYLKAFELWGGVAELKPQSKLLAFLAHYCEEANIKEKLEMIHDNESTLVKFAKGQDVAGADERRRFLKKLSNRMSISL